MKDYKIYVIIKLYSFRYFYYIFGNFDSTKKYEYGFHNTPNRFLLYAESDFVIRRIGFSDFSICYYYNQ